jgi:hypothetical protein
MNRVSLGTVARALTAAVVVAVFALSTYGFVVAVAISPAGSWVRRAVFDMDAGYCFPHWVEVFQLGPALAALAASGVGLYRAVGRRDPARSRLTWLLVGTALVFLVAWAIVQSAGECGLGIDD